MHTQLGRQAQLGQRNSGVLSGCWTKLVLRRRIRQCHTASTRLHSHPPHPHPSLPPSLLPVGAFVAYRVPLKADPHIPPLVRIVGIASADGTGPNATIVWRASLQAAAACTGCTPLYGRSVVWACKCATMPRTQQQPLLPLPAPLQAGCLPAWCSWRRLPTVPHAGSPPFAGH